MLDTKLIIRKTEKLQECNPWYHHHMEDRGVYQIMARSGAHDEQGSDRQWNTIRYIYQSEDDAARHRFVKFCNTKFITLMNL